MPEFPPLKFDGRLRPSQVDAVNIARRKLAEGHRRMHIVAPPGSGKTVLGLYLWAECIRLPAVVLSPNSAIQSQWALRAQGFAGAGGIADVASSDPRQPGWLTSLTYQAVTLPSRGTDDLDAVAIDLWIAALIEKNQAHDEDEALRWIEDLKRHNPDYHAERLSAYRKMQRDELARTGQSLSLLHESSLDVLRRLKERQIGLIILDECHHLLGHWGRVLADAHDFWGEPIVVGLTATPPDRDGIDPVDLERYDQFFGPIDYEVPIPAVVKDGFLSPYQDLAYFVRPTPAEIDYIANIDDQFESLLKELCSERPVALVDQPPSVVPSPPERASLETPSSVTATAPPENKENSANNENKETTPPKRIAALSDWLQATLGERRLPTGVVKDWSTFEKKDPTFAQAARVFLLHRRLPLPPDVPDPVIEPSDDEDRPNKSRLHDASLPMDVLVPVIDRYVRHGLRRSPHPDDQQLAETAIRRMRLLGVQITETGCQACASPASRVMAYSASKMLALPEILRVERVALGERIRAVIVSDFEKTSAVSAEVSHLLNEEAGGAMAAFRTLVAHPETDPLNPILLTGSSVLVDDDLADRVLSESKAWLTKNRYDVELTLEPGPASPQGTPARFRLLNGRGADWCPRVYVALITELFQRGVTRCLVGTRGLLGEGWDAHKINVLIDLTTVTTSMSINQLRGRSFRLDPDEPRKLANNWDVICLAPEFTQGLDDYFRLIRKHAQLFGVTEDGAIEKGIGHVHAAFTELKPEGVEGTAGVFNAEMLARANRRDAMRELWKIGQPYHPEPLRTVELKPQASTSGGFPPFGKSKSPWTDRSLSQAIGTALMGALREAGLITTKPQLHVGERSGGYVRLFLEQASKDECALFADSLQELFAPLHKPRYVIPRCFDRVTVTWLSRWLPGAMGRYFQKRDTVLAMWHAVPSALARNRDLVDLFERHWHQHVSPGKAVYALSGEGANIVKQARARGLTPHNPVHAKEVFL